MLIRQFTNSLVVMSHEVNTCSMFASQVCLRVSGVSMTRRQGNQLNTKDTDMEQALLIMLGHYQSAGEML